MKKRGFLKKFKFAAIALTLGMNALPGGGFCKVKLITSNRFKNLCRDDIKDWVPDDTLRDAICTEIVGSGHGECPGICRLTNGKSETQYYAAVKKNTDEATHIGYAGRKLMLGEKQHTERQLVFAALDGLNKQKKISTIGVIEEEIKVPEEKDAEIDIWQNIAPCTHWQEIGDGVSCLKYYADVCQGHKVRVMFPRATWSLDLALVGNLTVEQWGEMLKLYAIHYDNTKSAAFAGESNF